MCLGLMETYDKSAAMPWLSKGVLKQELSGIQVTTFLGVNNLQYI